MDCQVSPKSNLKYTYKRLTERRQMEERRPCEDGSRDEGCSHDQGVSGATRSGLEVTRRVSPLEPLREHGPAAVLI